MCAVTTELMLALLLKMLANSGRHAAHAEQVKPESRSKLLLHVRLHLVNYWNTTCIFCWCAYVQTRLLDLRFSWKSAAKPVGNNSSDVRFRFFFAGFSSSSLSRCLWRLVNSDTALCRRHLVRSADRILHVAWSCELWILFFINI